ncbi:MAG: DUF2723 domain-containing protein [Deltaproteobacteria bacterium]|nr:DUF2723 domain-containing protein [Deltaproteobacteria bacterium]
MRHTRRKAHPFANARTRRALATAAFLVPFALYLAGLCSTIHLGDSGELATATATLSVPHVPGYPVMTQAGFALSRIPIGSLAFRANLYSAICGALACWVLFLLLSDLGTHPAGAFALAVAFGAAHTVMEESLKIRAYPLNAAFAAFMLWRALRWRATGDRRELFLIAFAGALGLGNHQIVLASGVAPAAILIANWRRLRARDVATMFTLGVVGLSVYAYLPLRAMAGPVLNWGDPYNAERFFAALTQQQYAHKMLSSDWSPKLRMAGMILRSLVTEAGAPVLALGVLGAIRLAKSDRALLAGLVGVVLATIALRVNYIGQDEFHQVLRYSTCCTLMLVVAAAFGLREIFARSRPGFGLALAALAAAYPIAVNFPAVNASRHRVGEDFAKASLAWPEHGYALAVGGDNNVFPLWFFQRVERYRQDVVLLPRSGFDTDWIQAEVALALPVGTDLLRAAYRTVPFPVFYSTVENLREAGVPVYSLFSTTADPVEADIWTDWNARGLIVPCGLGFRIDGGPCDDTIWRRLPMSAYVDPAIPRDHHTRTLLDNVVHHQLLRSQSARKSGDLESALAAARTASAALPDDVTAALTIYVTLLDLGRADEAANFGDRLSERFPDDPKVLAVLRAGSRESAP